MNIYPIKPLQLAATVLCFLAAVLLWLNRGGREALPTSEGGPSPEAEVPGALSSPVHPDPVITGDTNASETGSGTLAKATGSTGDDADPTAVPVGASTTGPATSTPSAFPGYVPLKESPLARTWLEEEGITVEDIEVAQGRMLDRGFPPHRMDDPGLVRQFLPRRNIIAVNVTEVTLPERAASGSPVPFRIAGVYPDASYQFSRFDIVRENDVIRVRPMGESSGDVVPGEERPVSFEGSIEPLPPGEYTVEFPAAGPAGTRRLVIE